MARSRTPIDKALVTGSTIKNPARYRGRNEPIGVEQLGDPSGFLVGSARQSWFDIKSALFWLKEPDRFLLEIAASIRGKLIDGEKVGPTELRLLQSIIGKLGGSPSERQVLTFDEPKKPSNADRFFA